MPPCSVESAKFKFRKRRLTVSPETGARAMWLHSLPPALHVQKEMVSPCAQAERAGTVTSKYSLPAAVTSKALP